MRVALSDLNYRGVTDRIDSRPAESPETQQVCGGCVSSVLYVVLVLLVVEI